MPAGFRCQQVWGQRGSGASAIPMPRGFGSQRGFGVNEVSGTAQFRCQRSLGDSAVSVSTKSEGQRGFGVNEVWGPPGFGRQQVWAPTGLGPAGFGASGVWAPTGLGSTRFWGPARFRCQRGLRGQRGSGVGSPGRNACTIRWHLMPAGWGRLWLDFRRVGASGGVLFGGADSGLDGESVINVSQALAVDWSALADRVGSRRSGRWPRWRMGCERF